MTLHSIIWDASTAVRVRDFAVRYLLCIRSLSTLFAGEVFCQTNGPRRATKYERLLKLTDAQVTRATQRANTWLTEHHFPPTDPPKRTDAEQ